MSKYMDIVLCQKNGSKKLELFYAPEWSELKEGDMVVVETDAGDMSATVLGCLTVRSDEHKLFDFILKATHTYSPEAMRRVVSKIVFKELEYKED